jgi:CRISPR-associated endonuclease Csy4
MFYQDIKLFPDDEIDVAFLRNKLYQKLHKTLFDLKTNDIGISFPNLKLLKENDIPNMLLGNLIRLHSNEKSIKSLHSQNWLGGLSGYCKLGEILQVPSKIKGYQIISRIHPSKSESNLRSHINYQKNQGILKSQDDIKEYQKKYRLQMYKESLPNPYLELISTSTQNRYRVYLKFVNIVQENNSGEFNTFGLSKSATVPIF